VTALSGVYCAGSSNIHFVPERRHIDTHSLGGYVGLRTTLDKRTHCYFRRVICGPIL